MTKAEMEELKHCEVALEIHLGDNAHMDSARWLMAQRAQARDDGAAAMKLTLVKTLETFAGNADELIDLILRPDFGE